MPFDSLPTEPLTETEQEAREDLFRWLDRFPDRVPALLEAVREGRLDGSTYSGRCRCVIGTLHHATDGWWGVVGEDLDARGFKPMFEFPPIADFVHLTDPGHNPSNSPVMAHLERWIIQWQGMR